MMQSVWHDCSRACSWSKAVAHGQEAACSAAALAAISSCPPAGHPHTPLQLSFLLFSVLGVMWTLLVVRAKVSCAAPDHACTARHGVHMAWHGMAWHGMAWRQAAADAARMHSKAANAAHVVPPTLPTHHLSVTPG